MTPCSTKVARLHGGGEPRGDRLLAKREMARSLHQVLQEEVEGALLALADLHLQAVHGEPHFFADVIVDAAPGCVRDARRSLRHELFLERPAQAGRAGTGPQRN